MLIFALISVGMVAGFYAGYNRYYSPPVKAKTHVEFRKSSHETLGVVKIHNFKGSIAIPVAVVVNFKQFANLKIIPIYKINGEWRPLTGHHEPASYSEGEKLYLFPPLSLPVGADADAVGVDVIFADGRRVRETGGSHPDQWPGIVSRAFLE